MAGGIFLAAISLGGAVALYVIGGIILATSPVVLLDPEDDIPSKILYLHLEPGLAP